MVYGQGEDAFGCPRVVGMCTRAVMMSERWRRGLVGALVSVGTLQAGNPLRKELGRDLVVKKETTHSRCDQGDAHECTRTGRAGSPFCLLEG